MSHINFIKINTDLLTLNINSVGGDIRELSFNQHQAAEDKGKYLLMTDLGNPLFYVAQSGLLGNALPTHKSEFSASQKTYQMDSDTLIVPLVFENKNVQVKKVFEFKYFFYMFYTIKTCDIFYIREYNYWYL